MYIAVIVLAKDLRQIFYNNLVTMATTYNYLPEEEGLDVFDVFPLLSPPLGYLL